MNDPRGVSHHKLLWESSKKTPLVSSLRWDT